MSLFNKLLCVFIACSVAFVATLMLKHRHDTLNSSAKPQRKIVATFSRTTMPNGPVVGKPLADEIAWAKQYSDTNDLFDFASKAAKKALEGDGRAALYVSKALYTCLPIARQYSTSADPISDFDAKWTTRTNLPQSIIDNARKTFQSCAKFIKEDPFGDLPSHPGGYGSIKFWSDLAYADNDPLEQSLHAGSEVGASALAKSPDERAAIVGSAQSDIDKAVASRDPSALFQVGTLLSSGSMTSDPVQGFAISIAACDLGYDCTANNTTIMMFQGCAAEGTCPSGMAYSDIVRKAVGEDGYAQAYARAQQLEDAMTRGDAIAVQQFVRLGPGK